MSASADVVSAEFCGDGDAGAPSSAVIKRLRLLHHVLLQLSTLNAPDAEGDMGAPHGGGSWAAASTQLLQGVLAELPALAALHSEAIQEEVARCVLTATARPGW